jgi:hypothetical protein
MKSINHAAKLQNTTGISVTQFLKRVTSFTHLEKLKMCRFEDLRIEIKHDSVFKMYKESQVFYLVEVSRCFSGNFRRILNPTASEEVDNPSERYLLHGILCSAGTTIPMIAPSPKPTATSEGK